MSRYLIPAHNPEHVVACGWDNPLETFFLQVDDASLPDDTDHCICWQGTNPGELPTVAVLAAALAPYAVLSPEQQALLAQDYAQRTPPTALQRHMSRLLHRVRTMP